MRNVASVLLIVALVIGYLLFVHKPPVDPSVVPGAEELSETVQQAGRDAAEKVKSWAADAKGAAAEAQQKSKQYAEAARDAIRGQHEEDNQERDVESDAEEEEEDRCTPAFTRDYITDCEGFYRSAESADEDRPWPRSSKSNWPCPEQKQRWLDKLRRIQQHSKVQAQKNKDRQLTISRLEQGKQLGDKVFATREKNREGNPICWTEDLGSYYVDKFDVVPSEEFYYWVVDYDF